MHAKFQVEGFQNKRDTRNRSLVFRLFIFTRTFTGPVDLMVSCLCRQQNSG